VLPLVPVVEPEVPLVERPPVVPEVLELDDPLVEDAELILPVDAFPVDVPPVEEVDPDVVWDMPVVLVATDVEEPQAARASANNSSESICIHLIAGNPPCLETAFGCSKNRLLAGQAMPRSA
jgi:hypothetical protein